MQLNSQKSGSVCPYNIKHTLLSVGGKAVSSGTLALSLWPLTGHTGKAHPLKPAHLPLHCQPTSSLDWENKINHQLTHSLVQNIIPVRRYKYNHQIILDSVSLRLNSITARRAFDENPMPSRRAFRGMAGLAVLYPSVVDYIVWSLKTLWASSTGL